jgi:hypothetical protein
MLSRRKQEQKVGREETACRMYVDGPQDEHVPGFIEWRNRESREESRAIDG